MNLQHTNPHGMGQRLDRWLNNEYEWVFQFNSYSQKKNVADNAINMKTDALRN